MRLTVQKLLAGSPPPDRSTHSTERLDEQLAVMISKVWGHPSIGSRRRPTGNAFGDMWCLQVDSAQTGMEPCECVRIVGRRKVCGHAQLFVRHRAGRLSSARLVVGPQREREPVTYMNGGFRPRIELTHRAVGFGETTRDLCLERQACLPMAVPE